MINKETISKLSLINELSWPSRSAAGYHDNMRAPTTDRLKCEEMLKKIRIDRPDETIHEVYGFKMGPHDIIWVDVNMGANIMGTKVNHFHASLPYPINLYNSFIKQYSFKDEIL